MRLRVPLDVAFLVCICAVPLFLAVIASPYNAYLLASASVLAVAAAGVVQLLKFTGDLSFGHGVFLGIGAYVYSAFGGATSACGFVVLAIMALSLVFVASVLLYAMLWRVQGIYFTLATLCASEFCRIVVAGAYSTLGGDNGINGIARPSWMVNENCSILVSTVLVLVIGILAGYLPRIRVGMLATAARHAPHRIAALGVRPESVRFKLRILSAMPTGAAGVLLAAMESGAHPGLFGWITSGELITIALLLGTRWLGAPLLAASVIVWCKWWFSTEWNHWPLALGVLLILLARGRVLYSSLRGIGLKRIVQGALNVPS